MASVIPAKAGIQHFTLKTVNPRLRGDDVSPVLLDSKQKLIILRLVMNTNTYRYLSCLIMFSIALGTVLFCTPEQAVTPGNGPSYSVTIITPPAFRSGEHIPIIVRADSTLYDSLSGSGTEYRLSASAGTLSKSSVVLKKGIGSTTGSIESPTSLTISLAGLDGQRSIRHLSDLPRVEHSGTISASQEVWDSTAEHVVTGDLTIPPGSELLIHPGTRIVCGHLGNLIVNGTMRCIGTQEDPVFFASVDHTDPWGGIEVTDASARFEYCIFTNGGADPTRVFGHANCQPVVLATRSDLYISNCFFIDNIGKALASNESTVSLYRSLLSRCTTGGEFTYSFVDISFCHIIDIPDGTGTFQDNDNDGLYLLSHHPDHPDVSRISHCFFITGKDDAIDHNGARLLVTDCWIEGFMHEGLAASSGDTVTIYNTLFKHCEQGVEAGYGTPTVRVDHCVIVENDVGLRFGDSYDVASEGTLTAVNSVICSNTDDIYSFDENNTPSVVNGISVSYCLFNDSEYSSSPYCISGTPEFDAAYRLSEYSIGYSSASDTGPLGIVQQEN